MGGITDASTSLKYLHAMGDQILKETTRPGEGDRSLSRQHRRRGPEVCRKRKDGQGAGATAGGIHRDINQERSLQQGSTDAEQVCNGQAIKTDGAQRPAIPSTGDIQMKNSYKHFTKKDLAFIRRSFESMSNREIGNCIGRSAPSIGRQMVKMDLRRAGRKFYTTNEITWLRKNASKYSDKQLAEKFGTTPNSIKACIMNHKIKPGRNTCFKKGHRPANFRMKGYSPGGRSVLTRFPKGHLPVNTMEDGAITVRLDHPKDRNGRPYKWIRISMGKWIHYHRWIWEQANGPIPKTHVVIFNDGDTMNTVISNLKLVTKAENLFRNRNENTYTCAKNLTDNYVAGRIAGGDKKLRKAILLLRPELVELKRTQLKLKRQLNYERNNQAGKAAH